ncbi:MAG: beta-lactamase family protein [Pararhodobacter sp.]|nr:beta-lactamase family protein [Pararhodobacter sp.]
MFAGQTLQGWHKTARSAVLALCVPLALMLSALPLRAEPLGAVLEARIPSLMARHGVEGLNVIVLRGGREVWAGSFGMADAQAGQPMTRDRVFRVESISKPVTAWGVMHLVERGDVALDDVAWDHVTSWAPPEGTPPMTIRQLLSSSAGLGIGDFTARYPPDGPVPTLRDSMRGDFAVIGEPGAGFFYSNIGYNVLEILIEDVTGQPFSDFMAEAVLEPLDAGSASFAWSPALAAQMPVGHGLQEQRIALHVYAARAPGGLLADIDGIAAFVRAGMDASHGGARTVLTDASVARMHQAQVAVGGVYGVVTDGYGLGHFTETLSDGRHAVWHGGQGYGWMSHFHLVPETGDAIIMLANSQRAWPLFATVLGEWSGKLGVAPVGMARVAQVWTLGLAATIALALSAGAQALRLAIAVKRGRRRLLRPGLWRGMLAIGGGAVIALVLWAAAQEYLILHSVLPGLSLWLGLATAAAGVVMVLSAFWAPKPRS